MALGTPSDSELLDLVGDIYDCAIAPDKWPSVLERIALTLDGCATSISFHDARDNAVRLARSWNISPEFQNLMDAHIATNPGVPAGFYHDVCEPFGAAEFVGEYELKNSRWFHNTIGRVGIHDGAISLIAKSASRIGFLTVLRANDKPIFRGAELEPLRAFAPHVRRAVLISDLLDARALERNVLAATLDHLAVGLVLTDGQGRIMHTNAAADRYLDTGDAVHRLSGGLSARDAAAARDLAQAIADAARGTTVEIPRSGIVIPLKGETDLAAWVLPLDRGLRHELGAGFTAKVAVFIRDLGDTSPFPAELFVRRFAITPAECRVLMLLLQGMSVAEAAENLGISLPTARTHLAHLFEKTGTSRQIDLVRLAMRALSPVS
ncbi:LuxR C-terminal-related transcriptional regulator [Hyphomicrobium sp.]|uniref:helix-turn-helix transcriptional regulator n=1 Tax=Hyphomicrobium sp. TaxID=82 RepID=UPI0025BE9435|nr:LuxR C-terminal-related transcriptional regulator [Hyphomicrobium sp.]MCC7253578.1 hypothetical protein [Hyphomicrobium sp.]